MDDARSPISASLFVSAAGWVLAVVGVAVALFVGKPYFAAKGYEQGRATQADSNIRAVDEILARRIVPGTDYVVYGRFIQAQNGSLVFETLNDYLRNPLRPGGRTQTALIDASTVIEKRTVLPPEEFMRVLEDARRAGLSTQEANIHASEPLSLNDIPVGTEIRVYPRVAQDAAKDTFAAKQILWVISNQQASSNQDQL